MLYPKNNEAILPIVLSFVALTVNCLGGVALLGYVLTPEGGHKEYLSVWVAMAATTFSAAIGYIMCYAHIIWFKMFELEKDERTKK